MPQRLLLPPSARMGFRIISTFAGRLDKQRVRGLERSRHDSVGRPRRSARRGGSAATDVISLVLALCYSRFFLLRTRKPCCRRSQSAARTRSTRPCRTEAGKSASHRMHLPVVRSAVGVWRLTFGVRRSATGGEPLWIAPENLALFFSARVGPHIL